MTTPAIQHNSTASDKTTREPEIVYGVHAIAEAVDETDLRRVFYMLQQGQIPGARKIGRRWALSLRVFRREMHGDAA